MVLTKPVAVLIKEKYNEKQKWWQIKYDIISNGRQFQRNVDKDINNYRTERNQKRNQKSKRKMW